MKLEIRDTDCIWSLGTVLAVDDVRDGLFVIVHYDGWPKTFDERVLWQSERLAPPFTFSKCIKCFADIWYRQRGRQWPCKVYIRHPHPFVEGLDDEEDCLHAERSLAAEPNVFVQPYAPHLLSKEEAKYFDKKNIDGGIWIKTKELRLWNDDLTALGSLPERFKEAYHVALKDTETVGLLPSLACFEEGGALLTPMYRVHSRSGENVRDGALREASDIPRRLQEEPFIPAMDPSDEPPATVQIRQGEELEAEPISEPTFASDVPVPAPSLPPPIEISELNHHGCGVRRCKLTNQWTASLCLGGNEVLLGTFPTQHHAYQATRIASGENVEMETDLRKARLKDLQAVPIEAVTEAKEKQYNPAIHDFSMHDYSLQQIRYDDYLSRTGMGGEENVENGGSEAASDNASQPPRGKKRKGAPRKVDLEKHCYID